MICGFDNAIGVSVHVSHCTLHLFLGSWLEKGDSSFKVDDCGISRGNFQPTWHVQVTLRHLSCARSFIAHKALYWSMRNQMAAGGTYETYSFHEQAQKRFTMKCATFACTLVSHWLESSRQLSSHTILQTAKV